MDKDPYASEPSRFIGKTARFLPVGKTHGPQLVGIVTAQKWAGFTVKGHIPDYSLECRGGSGKVITVSLVENRVSFDPTT
jgi:hypothetical protein